jgi:hypothetical protein
MLLKEILEISGVVLGSLGGGAFIIFGFSSWLGKVWANRLMTKEKAVYAQELESLRNRLVQDTESYKIKLKKSEFIFKKEFEAASTLVALKRSFMPTYNYPDKDWYEACDEIAQGFHKIEQKLNTFLANYGAVLQKEVKDLIDSCITIATVNKFEVEGPNVSRESNKAADELYKKLEETEKGLLNQVHSQSST